MRYEYKDAVIRKNVPGAKTGRTWKTSDVTSAVERMVKQQEVQAVTSEGRASLGQVGAILVRGQWTRATLVTGTGWFGSRRRKDD